MVFERMSMVFFITILGISLMLSFVELSSGISVAADLESSSITYNNTLTNLQNDVNSLNDALAEADFLGTFFYGLNTLGGLLQFMTTMFIRTITDFQKITERISFMAEGGTSGPIHTLMNIIDGAVVIMILFGIWTVVKEGARIIRGSG